MLDTAPSPRSSAASRASRNEAPSWKARTAGWPSWAMMQSAAPSDRQSHRVAPSRTRRHSTSVTESLVEPPRGRVGCRARSGSPLLLAYASQLADQISRPFSA